MKRDIISSLKTGGLTEAAANESFDRVVDAIGHVVRMTGEARVPGLGTFKVKHRAERNVRNPRTGEAVRVAARNALTFKPSSTFTL